MTCVIYTIYYIGIEFIISKNALRKVNKIYIYHLNLINSYNILENRSRYSNTVLRFKYEK